MLVAVFEGQLGDSRLIEFPQPFRNHRVVLLFGRVSKRELETKFASKFERDPTVFGGVRSREKAAVFSVLHVFAVRLQNARGRTGFRKNFAQLINNLPLAFTSRLSPDFAKIFRIAASSLTTVMTTSDSAVTSDKF